MTTISAYLKLILAEALGEELSRVTNNGITVAEELEILNSANNDPVSGPFKSINALRRHLSTAWKKN